MRQSFPGWDAIRLGPLNAGGGAIEGLLSAMRAAGLSAREFFEFGNWYEPVPEGGFEAFVAARPSQLRNTWKRRLRKLERDTEFEMTIAGSDGGLEAALDAYQRIYSESWKDPEISPSFIPAMVRRYGAKDLLRLGTLIIDGRPAAAQIWLRDGHRAIIYKLAYDETMREYSAGTILTMHMAKHAIEVDRVSEIDYGSGDDPYKRDWMSKRPERRGVIGYNPSTLRGRAGGLRERVAAMLNRGTTPETAQES